MYFKYFSIKPFENLKNVYILKLRIASKYFPIKCLFRYKSVQPFKVNKMIFSANVVLMIEYVFKVNVHCRSVFHS